MLARHLVARYAQKMGKPVPEFSPKGVDLLHTYSWPGNVRELENVIERAVIVSRNGSLNLAESLPKPVVNTRGSRLRTLEECEREHILEALQFTGWQVSGNRGAALLLGLKPTTLEARMKKLGIERPVPPSAQRTGSSE